MNSHPHNFEAQSKLSAIDIALLFVPPAVWMLVANAIGLGPLPALVLALCLLVYGAMFYFFRNSADTKAHTRPFDLSERDAAESECFSLEADCATSAKTSWLDYAGILFLPITIVVALLYLVWTHTMLGKLALAVATIVIPIAVVLLSWFVIKHHAVQVKQSSKPGSTKLAIRLVLFWAVAAFIFIFCVATWIAKFGVR
jgi:hypothetical protein